MTVSEKAKTIDYKNKQSKGQYNLDKLTTKVSTKSSGMLVNINF